MNVEKVLHMMGGDGATSYAANSKLQENGILKARATVEEAIKEVCTKTEPKHLVIADLGCSSGPNTFLVLSEIIHAISEHYQKTSCGSMPELQCFLNDLPGNDFNTLFHYLEQFKKKLHDEGDEISCYVAALPASIYGHLFPLETVHFFHSSYCLMWLSQVPEGIGLNKGNIHISETSGLDIVNSYYEQFKRGFSTFLNIRYKELVPGGRMVVTFSGRKSMDARNGEVSCLWGLLADALNSLVQEGKLEEEKVDTFNLPMYTPSVEEVKELIINEGSFLIDKLQVTELNWDPYDDDIIFNKMESGKNVSECVRAVTEPMFITHFGQGIMDELFRRFSVNVGNHLCKKKTKHVTFIVSLRK